MTQNFNDPVPPPWVEFCKSGHKPNDMPERPDLVYADKWLGWDNFLCTEGWDAWVARGGRFSSDPLH